LPSTTRPPPSAFMLSAAIAATVLSSPSSFKVRLGLNHIEKQQRVTSECPPRAHTDTKLQATQLAPAKHHSISSHSDSPSHSISSTTSPEAGAFKHSLKCRLCTHPALRFDPNTTRQLCQLVPPTQPQRYKKLQFNGNNHPIKAYTKITIEILHVKVCKRVYFLFVFSKYYSEKIYLFHLLINSACFCAATIVSFARCFRNFSKSS
jgi:hypothetical protein